MAKAVVLGATGHIGAHVVRALLNEGHRVRATYRNEKFLFVLKDLPVERVRMDLNDIAQIRKAIEGCEWVFHCAGYYPLLRQRTGAIQKGVESVRSVFGEARRSKVARIVFTSSIATFSRREPGSTTGWKSLYASVKTAMEKEADEAIRSGVPIVLVNPALCIGEFDTHSFSGQAVLAVAKYRLPWTIHYPMHVVYTGDVGVGHVRAAQQGQVGKRYPLTGQDLSLKEFSQIVARVAGFKPPRWCLQKSIVFAAAWGVESLAKLTGAEPLWTRAEIREACNGFPLTGREETAHWEIPQTPIEEAVRRAVGWFRENGYL